MQDFKALEAEWELRVPNDQYVVLRLDGRSFHRYTRGLERPYDLQFMSDMDATAVALCREIAGARCAYVQSDEISLLITAFTDGATNAMIDESCDLMFGGRVQKLVSISAAIASATFNARRSHLTDTFGLFDSRVLTLETVDDVHAYFEHRQFDCQKNAVTMSASTVATHHELIGVRTVDRAQMIPGGRDAIPGAFLYGRLVERVSSPDTATFKHGRTGQMQTVSFDRNEWRAAPASVFGVGAHLRDLIPTVER